MSASAPANPAAQWPAIMLAQGAWHDRGVRSEAGGQVWELATRHDPMVSEPQALAEWLLGIQRGAHGGQPTGQPES